MAKVFLSESTNLVELGPAIAIRVIRKRVVVALPGMSRRGAQAGFPSGAGGAGGQTQVALAFLRRDKRYGPADPYREWGLPFCPPGAVVSPATVNGLLLGWMRWLCTL